MVLKGLVMCGIAGVVHLRDSPSVDRAKLERMAAALAHRGPDDEGFFVSGQVGLAHRRLSIIDLKNGHQPMSTPDRCIWIVFNGEIYNHAELRPHLQALGHRYQSRCDTETILHLYEEEGERLVHYLRGMFAFAIWDQRKRELLLARDRLGIKPLYYVQASDGSFYFASEIKSLLAVRAVRPELNHQVLRDYLANRTPSGEETLFCGVKRLPPGHTLRWRDGAVQIDEYWDVRFSPDERQPRRLDADYVEEWTERFCTSVRYRLMTDVPLGVFLSGGIDSSAITAVLARMTAEPIQTFSVAFAEREANELEYAHLVAQAFKTEHHDVVVRPEEYFAALPKLIWHEDEPLAHLASIPLYFVSRLASQYVKVVLTGEGSDELLAGYARYHKTMCNVAVGTWYMKLTSDAIRQLVSSRIEALPVGSIVGRKLTRTFLCLPPDIESIHLDNFSVFPRAMQHQLLTAEAQERIGPGDAYAVARRYLERTDAFGLLNRLLYLDIKTYLQELLMKQDQMSMAASIESRVPFLDHELVEFTARLPDHLKLRGARTKCILRRSMQGVLPERILRRRKMGFPVPIRSWFRGRFRSVIDEYVLSQRTLERRLFDRSFVHRLVAEHQSGVVDHSDRLWMLVNLEIWQRQFLDGEQVTLNEPSRVGTALGR